MSSTRSNLMWPPEVTTLMQIGQHLQGMEGAVYLFLVFSAGTCLFVENNDLVFMKMLYLRGTWSNKKLHIILKQHQWGFSCLNISLSENTVYQYNFEEYLISLLPEETWDRLQQNLVTLIAVSAYRWVDGCMEYLNVFWKCNQNPLVFHAYRRTLWAKSCKSSYA